MMGSALLAMEMTGAVAKACGDPGPGMQLLFNGMVAFFIAWVPAIYILARRRVPLKKKMLYLMGLVMVNLLCLGVLSLFANDSGDVLVSPLPWFFALLPGFGVGALFRLEPANPQRT